MRIKNSIILAISMIFSSAAISNETINNKDLYFDNYKDYLCTINEVWRFNDGKIIKHYQEKDLIGKQFTVDRRSGIVTGYLKNNLITNPSVTSRGTKDNNFKSISITPHEIGSTSVYILTISEFEENIEKSFKYDVDDMITTGKCVHF